MGSEGISEQNPIESLEENIDRRFVIGFNAALEVISPLIIAHEDRFNAPIKLNYPSLAKLGGVGEAPNRKGGFCVRIGQQLMIIEDHTPMQMYTTIQTGQANKEEFQKALANGIVVIEPPSQNP